MSLGNNQFVGQYIRVEQYRLHCVEEWPESSQKAAALAAIRSALLRLETAISESARNVPTRPLVAV